MRKVTIMKNLDELNQYRISLNGNMGSPSSGAFRIPIGNQLWNVIASSGSGWEHVSIIPYTADRCPKWSEMCALKDLFFRPEETVMQLHPAKSQYVNIHAYCLHLWRPIGENIPQPPIWMV